jgi:hypothetical protein
VDGSGRQAGLSQASTNLQQTADVPRGDDLGPRIPDAVELSLQDLPRHFSLQQVIHPGTAAAGIRVGQFDKPKAGDLSQDRPRLLPDALGVGEVACVVVGRGQRDRAQPAIPRDLCKDL